MSVWLACAIALAVGLGICAIACLRTSAVSALVALEVAGVVAAVALLVLSAEFQRQPFADVGLVLAVMSFVGSLAFLRYFERS